MRLNFKVARWSRNSNLFIQDADSSSLHENGINPNADISSIRRPIGLELQPRAPEPLTQNKLCNETVLACWQQCHLFDRDLETIMRVALLKSLFKEALFDTRSRGSTGTDEVAPADSWTVLYSGGVSVTGSTGLHEHRVTAVAVSNAEHQTLALHLFLVGCLEFIFEQVEQFLINGFCFFWLLR